MRLLCGEGEAAVFFKIILPWGRVVNRIQARAVASGPKAVDQGGGLGYGLVV
jgi:hypothetical protein